MTVVGSEKMAQQRLEKFHKHCVAQCSSRMAFMRAFEVNVSHVAFRGAQTASHLRWSLLDQEKLGSLIMHGALNIRQSKGTPPVEIAVEGYFKDFAWVDPSQSKGKMEGVDPIVCARVVVRESKPKNFVVTVYALADADPSTLPEVPNEIWN